jgi:leader peptidase (prepilin peptidase) / N-methyltransferase
MEYSPERREASQMPVAFAAAFAGVLGATVGSFLNVVAYRLPRRESLVRPGSRCPGCGTAIRPHDNLPVVGWLLLRGRCRSCRAAISPRYPIVEAITAALAVAVVLSKHSAVDLVLGLVLVGVLVPVALIDLEHQIIPNKITLPAAVAAVAIGAALDLRGVPEQLIAGAGAGGFLLAFALVYPRGMGIGDVKLAAVLGLFLGRSVGVAILAGVLTGTIIGAAIMARLGVQKGRKTKVPFGPFLALGGVIALFAGPSIVHWYLHAGI